MERDSSRRSGEANSTPCFVHRTALPALTHGSFGYLPAAGSYSMLMNVLGVPAGVVPITTVGVSEASDRAASHDWVERAALAVEADSTDCRLALRSPPGLRTTMWRWH